MVSRGKASAAHQLSTSTQAIEKHTVPHAQPMDMHLANAICLCSCIAKQKGTMIGPTFSAAVNMLFPFPFSFPYFLKCLVLKCRLLLHLHL